MTIFRLDEKIYIMKVMQDVSHFLFCLLRLEDDSIELDWILWDIQEDAMKEKQH